MNAKSGRLAFSVAFAFVFLIGGCILGAALVKDEAISFDSSVNVGQLLTILTTLIVALFVTTYFQRQLQNNKVEKDIILGNLDWILTSLDSFDKLKQSTELTEITASLKQLSIRCTSISELLTEFNYPAHWSFDFERIIAELRKLCTDTPITKLEEHAMEQCTSAEVRDGIISFTSERKNIIDNKVMQLRQQVFRGKIIINRF